MQSSVEKVLSKRKILNTKMVKLQTFFIALFAVTAARSRSLLRSRNLVQKIKNAKPADRLLMIKMMTKNQRFVAANSMFYWKQLWIKANLDVIFAFRWKSRLYPGSSETFGVTTTLIRISNSSLKVGTGEFVRLVKKIVGYICQLVVSGLDSTTQR